MLTIENKILCFKEYLILKKNNYGDTMKNEIYLNYFELENEANFLFLDKLNTKIDIENKVELLVNKMILHEHEDGLANIISNYI